MGDVTVRRTFAAIIERDVDGGFIATVPALPGCHSQGDTLDEVRSNVREAVELYVEGETLSDVPEFAGIIFVDI